MSFCWLSAMLHGIYESKNMKQGKAEKIAALTESAAKKVDAKSTKLKEAGGHMLTAANALKAGKAIPAKSLKWMR